MSARGHGGCRYGPCGGPSRTAPQGAGPGAWRGGYAVAPSIRGRMCAFPGRRVADRLRSVTGRGACRVAPTSQDQFAPAGGVHHARLLHSAERGIPDLEVSHTVTARHHDTHAVTRADRRAVDVSGARRLLPCRQDHTCALWSNTCSRPCEPVQRRTTAWGARGVPAIGPVSLGGGHRPVATSD